MCLSALLCPLSRSTGRGRKPGCRRYYSFNLFFASVGRLPSPATPMPATAPAPVPALDYADTRPAASRFRWVIAALLFFAITINYIDRQVFSILAPDLRKRYQIGEEVMADVGSVGGGWISSAMIKRGWSLNAGRKTTLLACALSVIPVVFAATVENKWTAVLLLGLATAAHQGFSCNIFTLVSDTFPRRMVGSVTGLGGTAGWLGTSIFATLVGLVLGRWGSYVPLFIVAGSAYLLAVLVIHLLAPRLDPAAIPDDGPSVG
jgi:sugar phosphate permease